MMLTTTKTNERPNSSLPLHTYDMHTTHATTSGTTIRMPFSALFSFLTLEVDAGAAAGAEPLLGAKLKLRRGNNQPQQTHGSPAYRHIRTNVREKQKVAREGAGGGQVKKKMRCRVLLKPALLCPVECVFSWTRCPPKLHSQRTKYDGVSAFAGRSNKTCDTYIQRCLFFRPLVFVDLT